jgi:hypothetical protein
LGKQQTQNKLEHASSWRFGIETNPHSTMLGLTVKWPLKMTQGNRIWAFNQQDLKSKEFHCYRNRDRNRIVLHQGSSISIAISIPIWIFLLT